MAWASAPEMRITARPPSPGRGGDGCYSFTHWQMPPLRFYQHSIVSYPPKKVQQTKRKIPCTLENAGARIIIQFCRIVQCLRHRSGFRCGRGAGEPSVPRAETLFREVTTRAAVAHGTLTTTGIATGATATGSRIVGDKL